VGKIKQKNTDAELVRILRLEILRLRERDRRWKTRENNVVVNRKGNGGPTIVDLWDLGGESRLDHLLGFLFSL
jgi:hypothetical protein